MNGKAVSERADLILNMLRAICGKQDQHDQKCDEANTRLSALERDFAGMKVDFAGAHARLDNIDRRLDSSGSSAPPEVRRPRCRTPRRLPSLQELEGRCRLPPEPTPTSAAAPFVSPVYSSISASRTYPTRHPVTVFNRHHPHGLSRCLAADERGRAQDAC